MVHQKLLRVMEREYRPEHSGRELSLRLQERYRQPLQKVRRRRFDERGHPRMTTDSLRNRVVIQQMKIVYEQLLGVGDQLVSLRISSLVREARGLGSLGRMELSALNYDVAKLAASIFGPTVANAAYERISGLISRAFD